MWGIGFATIVACFVEPSKVCGSQGTFVCPSVVISPRAGRVDVEIVGVGMFKGRKLADLLSFWEWSQDVCDDGTGAMREAFQIAEPV
jgi:hypothetical protein